VFALFASGGFLMVFLAVRQKQAKKALIRLFFHFLGCFKPFLPFGFGLGGLSRKSSLGLWLGVFLVFFIVVLQALFF
jgi:hypothetical protein